MFNKGNQRFELVVICLQGCFRFLLGNKKAEDNTVSGIQAARSIYKKSDELGIDLTKYTCDSEQGLEYKKQIESPHIQVMMPIMLGKTVNHVYHMDFKSSYASRICEKYPELLPLYESLFKQRKDNDGYYKHVLTNSIGCFQSEYCPDYNDRRHSIKYQFALLSKTAVNGTREKVEYYLKQLNKKGFIPLLTNTDGIWYYSPTGKPYHDKYEGDDLGKWENDHKDCKFLMTSTGTYQYVENGICKSVVRGKCNLDTIEPDRNKWEFGIINRLKQLYTYKFDPEKGVIKTWQNDYQKD